MSKTTLVLYLIQFFSLLAASIFATPNLIAIASDPTSKSALNYQQTVNYYQKLYNHTPVSFMWNGSVEKCQAGIIPDEILILAQKRINFFRAVNGLSPISINPLLNPAAQEAALIMASNAKLSHYPDPSWNCYSELGAKGAKVSNLTLGNYDMISPKSLITGFIWDYGYPNYFVGHRRWLLYSRLAEVGYGLTTNSEAVNVAEGIDKTAPKNLPDFIAYPWNGFVPVDLIFPKWSFSIPEGELVDFSNVQVSMKDWNGKELTIKLFPEKKMLDPTITWEASDLFTPYEIKYGLNSMKEKGFVGHVIEVKISNVLVGGKLKNYIYKVSVI